jgi:hypothetical protein
VKLVTSGIATVSGQGNEVHYYDLAPFIHLLRTGINTIAVRLDNVWQPSWDDVAFDLSLKAMAYAPVETRFNAISMNPGPLQGLPGVDLGVSVPANSIWRIESSDTLSPPNWQFVEAVTNHAASPFWLRDTGQNGRPPPTLAPVRFYRLKPN